MKKFFFIFFLILFSGAVFYAFWPKDWNSKLASPWIGKGSSGANLWFPQVMGVTLDEAPEITAKSAYFIDIDSGKVLYSKMEHARLPVASLVKIMTVIVALKNMEWQDKVYISQKAASMEPDHMELIAGEKLSVEELLDGVFLVSANDAAEALAEAALGDREEFIKQMNLQVELLGIKDTLFINPTGLQEEGRDQYSSAYDMALMSRYAIKHFPHTVDISSLPHILLPRTLTHQDYDLYSGINLLTTYPGVLGFKTGYTPEAGLTLVTLAKKDGHEVLGVILNSEYRRDEARSLLDYSFKKLAGI
ncbi:MAG: serine hydrolase [bacterium]|nr:serine hydrolase [bacterium]